VLFYRCQNGIIPAALCHSMALRDFIPHMRSDRAH
jgi:hypothetical protein